jgi:hypothetical protein|tara:strand:- start:480 stop:719 length:240 start_codon:yes stop_codon:yes gene_type:complete
MSKEMDRATELLKNSFYFESDLHPEKVRWRYKNEALRPAYFHKTYKPKLSDLVIETKLPKDLKLEIRRDLLASIQEEDR